MKKILSLIFILIGLSAIAQNDYYAKTLRFATTWPAYDTTTTKPNFTLFANPVSGKVRIWYGGTKSTVWPVEGTGGLTGSGIANEIAYWTSSSAIGSLTTGIYPSLTELSYVKGVTSELQTQLNNKQPLNSNLTSWAAITRGSGFDTFAATPSWTNFNSMITGTAPFWSLASGGTATGNNTLTFGSNTLTFTGNSHTTGTLATFSSSSLTSGTGLMVDITGTAALTGSKAIYGKQSGANASGSQTTYSIFGENDRTGSGTNIGVYGTASGGTTNWSGYFTGNVNINSSTNTDNYPVRIAVSSTGRGIKLGNLTNPGSDHASALNISNDYTVDTGELLRSIKVLDQFSAKQFYNLYNAAFGLSFSGSTTYNQNNGPGGVYSGTGNIALQLRGDNANLTIPSHIYISVESPTAISGSGSMSGTVQNLYGLYVADMTKGSTTNYSIFTNAGDVWFGGNTYLNAVSLIGRSANVTHGITTLLPTDQYFIHQMNSSTTGGVIMRALTDDGTTVPLTLNGLSGSTSFTGEAAVSIIGHKRSGTTTSLLDGTEKVMNIKSGGNIRMTFYGDGASVWDMVNTTGNGTVFNLNSLTTGIGSYINSSSITTGFLEKWTSTSTVINHTAGTHALVGVDASGANSTSGKTVVGFMSKVANAGTSSTNVAGYFSSSGATNNYSILTVGDMGMGTTTPTAQLHINGRTLSGGSTTDNWLNITGTMPTTMSAATYANLISVTGAGSSGQPTQVLRVLYNAGYTGSFATSAVVGANLSSGTNTTSPTMGIQTGNSNFFVTIATTTGHNFGMIGQASGGDVNAGFVGQSQTAKNSAGNFGVIGLARNTGSSSQEIGGYFALLSDASSIVPSNSGALIATNGTTTRDIFRVFDNVTEVVKIADGGLQTNTAGLNLSGASSPLQVGGSAGISGQVFTSAGPGATPTWTSISGVLSGLTTNRMPYASSATTIADTYLAYNGAGTNIPVFYIPTSDGSDAGGIILNGGGNTSTPDATRGASIQINGNEYSGSAGNILAFHGSGGFIALGTTASLYVKDTNTTIGAFGGVGTSATNTLGIKSGTAPAGNVADMSQVYSADISAGNAALHTRTEGGEIMSFGTEFGMQSNTDLIFVSNSIEYMRLTTGGNLGIGTSSFGTSAAGVIAIKNGTAPSSSPADQIQLYAEDIVSSSELRVRDEAGNTTTLSPHNFSIIDDGPSEPGAWSFYGEYTNPKTGERERINVDMLAVIREVEKVTGKKFVYKSVKK